MSPESSRYLCPFPLRRLITFPHLPPPSLLPGGAVPAGPGGSAEDAGSPRVPCPRASVREKLTQRAAEGHGQPWKRHTREPARPRRRLVGRGTHGDNRLSPCLSVPVFVRPRVQPSV